MYRTRRCIRCEKDFEPNSSNQKCCSICAPIEKREYNNIYNKRKAATHLEKERTRIKKWRKAKPEKERTSHNKWRKDNPEKTKTINKRHGAKRRALGFNPLNQWFEGCEGHHLDNELVIHMPKALHDSIWHRQSDKASMAKINAVAYNFLFKQEAEEAIRQRQENSSSQNQDDATHSTERCSSQRSST